VRSQDLVLRGDGLHAGTVTRWEWFVSSFLSAGTFTNFYIKLCHTPRTALGEDFQANYGGNTPTVVYYHPSQPAATTPYSWFTFDFQQPFEYNGADNLIVEVQWKGRTASPSSMSYWTKRNRACAMAIAGPTTPAVYDRIHYMRITITAADVAATTLGRVKALYR